MTENIIHISEYDSPRLEVFSRLNENGLKRYYEPEPGLFIAESPKVIARALAAGYEPEAFLLEEPVPGRLKDTPEEEAVMAAVGAAGSVPVYTADMEVLKHITGFELTRGMLCAMRRKLMPSVSDIAGLCSRAAVLYNIENPTNVGALFRNAAALGMDGVFITRDSSDPLYRRAARVSMGTVFQIPWTYMNGTEDLKRLKEQGFLLAAMAIREDSAAISDPRLHNIEKLAVIIGNEGDGLPDEVLDICDYTVMIPMRHGVDSLNAAAAGALAFWELRA